MDEEVLGTSVRRFLKKMGIQAQREIDQAIRQAVKDGRLDGDERLDVVVTLTLAAVDLDVTIDGEIELE